MGEPLAADFLSNRAVELCPEKLIEFRATTTERVGDLRCSDGFAQMGADEQKCDRWVGNGDDVCRASRHDSLRRNENCSIVRIVRLFDCMQRSSPGHQLVQESRSLITAAFEILVDGGKRNGLVFADEGIVAD